MHVMGRTVLRVDREHVLLLKGLLLLSGAATAFLGAWHYGLVARVWSEDPTGISVGITVVFALAAGHGGHHLLRLSGQLNHVERVEAFIGAHGATVFRRGLKGREPEPDLPQGCVTTHSRHLLEKARRSGPRPIDQRLLLESLDAELRRGHHFGWFVADLLLSLGLLGTVIGFILMLGPLGGLDAEDHAAVKAALATMSNGMAVALYTTLTGLIGGMLLKVLGHILDGAVDELVRRTTQLTEVHIIPAIEREARHATT